MALDYVRDVNVDIVAKVQSDTPDCVTKEGTSLDDVCTVIEDKMDVLTNVQLDTLDCVTNDNVDIVTKVQSDTPDCVTKEGAVLDEVNEVTEDKLNVVTTVQSDSSMLEDVTNVVTTEQSNDLQEKQFMMKVDMVTKEHVDVTDLDSTLPEVKEDDVNVVIKFQSDVPKEQVKLPNIAMEDKEQLKKRDDTKEREINVKTNSQEKTVIDDVTAQSVTKVLCHDVQLVNLETRDDVTKDKVDDATKEKSIDCLTEDKVDGVTKERTEKIEQSVGLDDGVSKVESQLMKQSELKDMQGKVAGVIKVQSEPTELSVGSDNVTSSCFKDNSATLSRSEITDNATAVQLKSKNNEFVGTTEVPHTGVEKMTQQAIQEDNVSVVDQEAKKVTSDQLKTSDKAQEEIAVVKVNTVESAPGLSEINSGITNQLSSDSKSENCLVPKACEGSRAEDDIKSVMETSLEAEVKCDTLKLTKISCETYDKNLQTTQEETDTLSKNNIKPDAKESQSEVKDAKREKQEKDSTTPLPDSTITKGL